MGNYTSERETINIPIGKIFLEFTTVCISITVIKIQLEWWLVNLDDLCRGLLRQQGISSVFVSLSCIFGCFSQIVVSRDLQLVW